MLDRQTVVEYLRSLSQDEIAGLLPAANVIGFPTRSSLLLTLCGGQKTYRA